MLFTTAKPQRCILQRHHPLTRGLVAAWPMDDAGGKIVRDAAGTNHGTAQANGKWGPGPSGGTAMTLNGSSDYVNMGEESALQFIKTNSFTISALVNLAALTEEGYINYIYSNYLPDDYSGVEFATLYNGTLVGVIGFYNPADGWHRLGALTASGVINNGTWYHAVYVHRSTAADFLYVDGVDKTSTTFTDSSAFTYSANHTVYIGARDYVMDSRYMGKGTIQDVRIYNRALSAAEVAEIYRDPWAIYRPQTNIYVATALAHIAAYRQLRRRV